MITYLRERGLLGVVNGLWMSAALWLVIIWLIGCGGQPTSHILPVPAAPAPVAAPPPAPTIPTTWTVTDLAPLPGFNASQANAVNAAGVVVGYSETPLGVTEATMWATCTDSTSPCHGQVIDLGPGIATAVNDSNHVVGYSVDDTGL